MEIIPLMLIAVIILLTSFPAPTKVLGKGGGGNFVGGTGYVGNGGGYYGGGGSPGSGYKGGGGPPFGTSPRDGSNVGSGYKGGASPQDPKKIGGGDPGAAIVVIPKKPGEPAKPNPPMPMPQECKPEVRRCINDHVYGTAGPPKYHGPCCVKLRYSVPCVCKFLSSPDPKLKRSANDLLGSCHYRKPKCGKISMPQECRPEVRHCVNVHLYGGAGQPQHKGACCTKFKTSKKCVCKFIKSIDPHLNKQANGVIRGCRFGKANCP